MVLKQFWGWLHKEVFQSSANSPLADSMGYIVNKFQHVWGTLYNVSKLNEFEHVQGSYTMRSKLNKFEHV